MNTRKQSLALEPADAQRFAEERFPVEMTGVRLALVMNALALVVTIAMDRQATADVIWDAVQASLADLGNEGTQQLLAELANAMHERFSDSFGDVTMLNPGAFDAQAVLGGAQTQTGGLVS